MTMKTEGSFARRAVPAILILLSAVSCMEKDGPEIFLTGQDEADISNTLVRASPPPLFADLPGDSGRSDTKGLDEKVPLVSVLDRVRQKKAVFKGISVVQIPFSDGYSLQKAYYGREPGGEPGDAAVMKRFLVTGPEGMTVVTMIADSRYVRAHPGFDYLDRPDYTGAVVFSTVYGELLKVQAYDGGRILAAEFVSSEGTGDAYIVVYSWDGETRSADGAEGVMTCRYVIALKPEGEVSPWFWDPDGSGEGSDPQTPEKYYTLSLSCDIPDKVEMTGGGAYTAGSTAVVGYRQKYSVQVHTLDHWTGDFAWSVSARFSMKVTEDMESTAYFETKRPAANNSKHVTNPLISMRIAASNVSMVLADADERVYANYYGGTFGLTRVDREGNPRRHDGLDLYADVGTPVYAAYSGTISKAVSGYGDSLVANSYGNELRITTAEGGRTFVTQYAHLQGGRPFAVNPRTGQPFKEDDKVYQGDLIAYSGRTGNAVDVPNPHLHLGIYTGGRWVDPKPYINGTYPSGQKSIDKGKGRITNIRYD